MSTTPGITTTTRTEIDWYQLGQHLASLTDSDQGAFLDGFAAGLQAFGPAASAHQIVFIADAAPGLTKWLATELAAAYEPTSTTGASA